MFDYNSMSKPLTFDDINKINEQIKNMEPVATEIEVLPTGYDFLNEHIEFSDDFRTAALYHRMKSGISSLFGLRVIQIEKDDKLKDNKARIKYSDGSSEIINIFKLEG